MSLKLISIFICHCALNPTSAARKVDVLKNRQPMSSGTRQTSDGEFHIFCWLLSFPFYEPLLKMSRAQQHFGKNGTKINESCVASFAAPLWRDSPVRPQHCLVVTTRAHYEWAEPPATVWGGAQPSHRVFWKALFWRSQILTYAIYFASLLLIIVSRRLPSAGAANNVASPPVSVLPLLHLLSYFGSSTWDIRLWICVSEQKSHSRLWDYAHTLNLFLCRDSMLIFGAAQSVFRQLSRCSVFSASPHLQVLPDYDMFLASLKVVFLKHVREKNHHHLFDAAASSFVLCSFNFPLQNWWSG